MKKIYLLLFLCVASVSCNEWFDMTPDGTSIPEDRFFRNENVFLNALTDVYTQLRAESLYGRMLSVGELEFMGQNFQPAGTDFRAAADLDYADAVFRSAIEQTFVDMYKAIASCNNVIAHIENTNIVFNSKSRKRIITGELYGLRAALHFELLRLFHPAYAVDPGFVGLPYMVRFGMTASEPLSTEAFVGKVIADLERAASELETADPVLNGFTLGTVLPGEIDSRLRTFCLNYYAVTTLLARVYLYKGDYEQAAFRHSHPPRGFPAVGGFALRPERGLCDEALFRTVRQSEGYALSRLVRQQRSVTCVYGVQVRRELRSQRLHVGGGK